ncbi:ATP-binding cassette domain-containing protein [Halocella sp. SP3-1]|uniref:ATP-binding cassette domain-containing protein n=1 Tax=Halocella sp. SP3-1 TaxID=2382161 RepID=UPI000F75DB36|nr:ATP-binding cassette domain-containing protein [Halocella sp. SP3-1]AZO94682.1 ATP-binding cassette domain-containing protein [Halocella sp. SP3-1]
MEKNIILEINSLSFYNNDWTNLEDVLLKICKGEIFALIGETGSGKTTLVNILAGIINDYEGRLLYKDYLLVDEVRKREFGFLFENSSLIKELSVAENLALIKYPRRGISPLISWKKVNKQAAKAFDKFGLEIEHHKTIGDLMPEKQKLVEIIKLVLAEPEILVLHEPTNNLNVDTINILYDIINYYTEKGGTVIYVTRQWEEALKVADNIAVLTKGKIAGVLNVDDAKKNPQKLINLYLGNSSNQETEKDDMGVIDSIFKAAEFLASEYELKDILNFFAERVSGIMGANSCIIDLIDEKAKTVINRVLYNHNNLPELKLDKKIEIIKNNKLFYLTERDKEFKSFFEDDPVETKTLICAPVLMRSQLAGIIELYYENIFVYSEKEWKYLSTLARQAGIAVEDTRLMGRSALLKESHHRIKNNLQSIISLISIQRKFLRKNKNITIDFFLNILDDIISRIKSIAAVHDLLSKDELGRSIINLKQIVKKVLEFAAYPNYNKEITINLNLEDIFIPYNKATTIMLIVNELLTNCYEHAFQGRNMGVIEIDCQKKEDGIWLIVRDDGIGLPDNFDIKNTKSLGLSIVQSIIFNEFHGSFQLNSRELGTEVRITLPL